METCEAIQTAVITLPPKEFAGRRQLTEHIASCDACKQFVEDVRDIREAGGPSWYLKHLPKSYWADLSEAIKVGVYQRSRSELKPFVLAPLFVTCGAIITLLFFHFNNASKLPSHLDWAPFWHRVATATNMSYKQPWQPTALGVYPIRWLKKAYVTHYRQDIAAIRKIYITNGRKRGISHAPKAAYALQTLPTGRRPLR